MPSPFTGPLWPGDPLMMLMMTGAGGDPQLQDQVAHYLAMQYQPPPIPDKKQAEGGSTTVAPGPTVAQQTPQMRTPGDAGAMASSNLPSGEPDKTPASSSAITGADAGSNQPTQPLSYAGSQPYNFANYPYAGASPKDKGTWAGTEGGNTSQVGAADSGHIPGEAAATETATGAFGSGSADPTGTSNVGDQASKIGSSLTDFGKALGALAPPQKEDLRTPLPPLPGHESRFTPQDLLALVQGLSQAGSRTAPQSLGALIGR